MKCIMLLIGVLWLCAFSPQADYVRVELGKGFSYYSDAATSEIHYAPAQREKAAGSKYPEVVWPAVSRVERLGFNDDNILASSKAGKGISYWIIDKAKDPEQTAAQEQGDRIALSHVKKVDSAALWSLQKKQRIIVRPVSYYRQALSPAPHDPRL